MEGPLKVHYEGVANLGQNGALVHDVPNFVFSFNLRFLQALYSIQRTLIFSAHLDDIRKSSLAYDFQELEVLQVRFLLGEHVFLYKGYFKSLT